MRAEASPLARAETPRIEVDYPRVSTAGATANVLLVLLGAAFLLPMVWMLLASIDATPDWAI